MVLLGFLTCNNKIISKETIVFLLGFVLFILSIHLFYFWALHAIAQETLVFFFFWSDTTNNSTFFKPPMIQSTCKCKKKTVKNYHIYSECCKILPMFFFKISLKIPLMIRIWWSESIYKEGKMAIVFILFTYYFISNSSTPKEEEKTRLAGTRCYST